MKYFIAGGCGFIGSTVAKALLEEKDAEVVIYDNLSNGRLEFLDDCLTKNIKIIIGDIEDMESLIEAMRGCDVVFHFASNADIAKASIIPTVDFYDGTVLTQQILEAMRILKIKRLMYASGSGVYGKYDGKPFAEEDPIRPISPYGASKAAGEAMISAYSHMFDIQASIFRFANVIGGNQTHGIISDIIGRLKLNPALLTVFGNGEQSKGYLYVDDVVDAMLLVLHDDGLPRCDYFNVAPYTTVKVWQIVNAILYKMDLLDVTKISYGNTVGGWKGDVPVVVMDSSKIRAKGWTPKYNTTVAINKTIREILGEG